MKLPGKMLPEVWRHLPKKPATVLYPFEKLEIPEGFRGYIKFYLDRCVGCGVCARDCPSGACQMKDLPEGSKPKARPVFHMDRCLFCQQCEENCPKDAIELTKEYEVSVYDRGELYIE